MRAHSQLADPIESPVMLTSFTWQPDVGYTLGFERRTTELPEHVELIRELVLAVASQHDVSPSRIVQELSRIVQ